MSKELHSTFIHSLCCRRESLLIFVFYLQCFFLMLLCVQVIFLVWRLHRKNTCLVLFSFQNLCCYFIVFHFKVLAVGWDGVAPLLGVQFQLIEDSLLIRGQTASGLFFNNFQLMLWGSWAFCGLGNVTVCMYVCVFCCVYVCFCFRSKCVQKEPSIHKVYVLRILFLFLIAYY